MGLPSHFIFAPAAWDGFRQCLFGGVQHSTGDQSAFGIQNLEIDTPKKHGRRAPLSNYGDFGSEGIFLFAAKT